MLPVTTRRRTWISNRLAAVAAVLLMTSSVAGVIDNGGMDQSAMPSATTLIGSQSEAAAVIPTLNVVDRAVKRTRGFRMSLFLFPRG